MIEKNIFLKIFLNFLKLESFEQNCIPTSIVLRKLKVVFLIYLQVYFYNALYNNEKL